MAGATLLNRRILVVEDEYMLAEDMQRGLEKAGAIVLGPVPSVEDALELLDDEPHVDGAVLDINLGGEKVFRVADALGLPASALCSRPATTPLRCLQRTGMSRVTRSR